MAKKLNLTLVMIISLLFSANLHAGELTFGWNKYIDYGQIWDMEFMPGHDNFIMMTDTCFEVRNTETGELINTYPKPGYGAPQGFEYTPDSTRIILYCGDIMEVRNVSDMSIIYHFVIPPGTDTAGYDIYESNIRFYELVVDPVRPYVYAIRSRSGYLDNSKSFIIRKIVIYNYETMEEVGILTTKEEENNWFSKLAISRDGKYLAVNNEGPSAIRVWDLNSRERIRNHKIGNYNNNEFPSNEPTCTKFSELNTDLIYFSGSFLKTYTNLQFHGILVYSISQDRIVDSTFATAPNNVYKGYFTFLDNEERAIKTEAYSILILSLKNKKIEKIINQDTITNGLMYWSKKSIYSATKKLYWDMPPNTSVMPEMI